MFTKEMGLEWLLSPITTEQFFEEWWEQKPLHITDRGRDYYQGLFSVKDIDHALMIARIDPTDIYMSKDRIKLPKTEFLDEANVPRMNKIYDLFDRGHSLYFYQVHRRNDQVRSLCRNLEGSLQQICFPAGFMTPPKTYGASPHYDVPNLLVVQLEGKKVWRLYQPKHEKPFRQIDVQGVANKDLGEPVMEVELNPGDLLYCPRGFVHEPFTTDSFSLHLTLGFMARVWHEVMTIALSELLEGHPEFREALPPGLFNPEHREVLETHSREMLQHFTDAFDMSAVMNKLRESYLSSRVAIPDGHFEQVRNLERLTPETVLEIRSGVQAFVIWEGEWEIAMVFDGGKVTGPMIMEPLMREIADMKTSFTVAGLKMPLPSEKKMDLVRRLIKNGMLRMVD